MKSKSFELASGARIKHDGDKAGRTVERNELYQEVGDPGLIIPIRNALI